MHIKVDHYRQVPTRWWWWCNCLLVLLDSMAKCKLRSSPRDLALMYWCMRCLHHMLMALLSTWSFCLAAFGRWIGHPLF